ncbi:MAG: triose-phosphate isomerase [bacterium]
MNILIANWKMNPQTAKEAKALFEAESNLGRLKNIEVVICPPACFLPLFSGAKNLKLGGQDLFWENPPAGGGAYTGEVSGKMLRDLGCEYAIVGHSERREHAGETDEIINAKLKTALKSGLTPILCVGEREGEEMSDVVAGQIKKGLADIGKNQLEKVIIAYEPVWAISTSAAAKECSPDNALSAAVFIRKILTEIYSNFLAQKVAIIYGGSVDAGNGVSYIKQSQMAGLLVGGASLDSGEFVKLGEGVNNLVI